MQPKYHIYSEMRNYIMVEFLCDELLFRIEEI